jgi:hypothetical protein
MRRLLWLAAIAAVGGCGGGAAPRATVPPAWAVSARAARASASDPDPATVPDPDSVPDPDPDSVPDPDPDSVPDPGPLPPVADDGGPSAVPADAVGADDVRELECHPVPEGGHTILRLPVGHRALALARWYARASCVAVAIPRALAGRRAPVSRQALVGADQLYELLQEMLSDLDLRAVWDEDTGAVVLFDPDTGNGTPEPGAGRILLAPDPDPSPNAEDSR